jgi:acyl-CoA synthetase (AMP-forming)/AMP-acid ligase II
MQTYGLTIDKFLDHAAKWFGDHDIVGAEAGVAVVRLGYAPFRERANRLSGALATLGLGIGDKVATLAWNTPDHLEVYYGAMGMGLVCHTLNPRLTAAQLAVMVNEADDRLLAVSADLLPLARELLAACSGVRYLVLLDGAAMPPPAELGDVRCWSLGELRDVHGAPTAWGVFDENLPAGLCYTSGTTGPPKGVLYTHRSNYLHTLRALQADAVGLTARDVLLLAVPMFHANGWGLPFAAPAAGTKIVLPGRHLDGASLARLMRDERVTVAVGVQTVWLGVADHLEETGETLPALERVLVGGSACTDAVRQRLERVLGARVQTSWGMTELSPVGTIAPPHGAVEAGAGRPTMGLDLKLTDADGLTLPEQRGKLGYLKVKGASVVDRYFAAAEDVLDADGYFDTGDLAMIDTAGNLTICGRAKDLIKSGGEWINPAEIESIIGAHPAVRHVAVIARADARWGERPILIVEQEGDDPRGLLRLLEGKVADWWVPREVAQVDSMPLSATGKIDKNRLRADYASGAIVTQDGRR